MFSATLDSAVHGKHHGDFLRKCKACLWLLSVPFRLTHSRVLDLCGQVCKCCALPLPEMLLHRLSRELEIRTAVLIPVHELTWSPFQMCDSPTEDSPLCSSHPSILAFCMSILFTTTLIYALHRSELRSSGLSLVFGLIGWTSEVWEPVTEWMNECNHCLT